jgi:hypothetical protein
LWSRAITAALCGLQSARVSTAAASTIRILGPQSAIRRSSVPAPDLFGIGTMHAPAATPPKNSVM